jgi:hypothetical protein
VQGKEIIGSQAPFEKMQVQQACRTGVLPDAHV